MPGFPDCPTCDFRDRPEVCHSLASNSPGLCGNLAQYRDLVRRRTLNEPKAALPGIAVNAATAVARFVVAGSPHASPEQVEIRMAACTPCPMNEGGRCRSCGCFLSIKTTWATEACPEGLWGPVEGLVTPPPSSAQPDAPTHQAAPQSPCRACQ